MKKDSLEKLYRTWGDKKLLDAFNKRHEYTNEALDAMRVVLEERGLSAYVQKEFERESLQKKAVLEAQKKMEVEKKQREDAEGIKFVNEQLVNGLYIRGEVQSGRVRFYGTPLFAILVLSLFLAIFSITAGSIFKFSFEISAILSIICVILLISLFRNSNAKFTMSQNGSWDVFELKHRNYSFRASVPFEYFVCRGRVEYRKGLLKISQDLLFLGIKNKNNETLILREYLNAWQSAPSEWPHWQDCNIPEERKYYEIKPGIQLKKFREIEPTLIDLKKILDGLHALRKPNK